MAVVKLLKGADRRSIFVRVRVISGALPVYITHRPVEIIGRVIRPRVPALKRVILLASPARGAPPRLKANWGINRRRISAGAFCCPP